MSFQLPGEKTAFNHERLDRSGIRVQFHELDQEKKQFDFDDEEFLEEDKDFVHFVVRGNHHLLLASVLDHPHVTIADSVDIVNLFGSEFHGSRVCQHQ